ncbi:MAG: peptidoglycan DD-metalloendopeptidase family protein [Reichenbachiella sp.]|uniref:murein hydrolase activator EnvC family protein n=1 Tax=Reichenbachiella sp. TaxID=2184521 RepID=UPI0032653E68
MTQCKFFTWLFLITTLFCTYEGIAQKSKSQIEKEKKDNLAKISEVQKILKETETEKKASIGQLQALNKQIEARRALISSITQEIELINGEISDLSIVVNSLQTDLEHLKDEYGQMIYDAYKANQGFSKLTFLFSAETFNQLFLRLKYLEQYTKAREVQVEQIEKVRDALNQQMGVLVVKKEEQDALLKSKVKENKNLLSLKNKQSKVVQELSKREKELRAEVAETKKAVTRLDKLLAKIIKAEIEKSNAGKNANSINLTADMARISTSFEGKRNRLPWPVQSGFVSERFGKHPHPVLKNIWVENQGVDIQTQKNAQVKAVFEGKVATTAFVPGMNRVVIVQHGDYYTLYAKLKTVNVKKGQVLRANESLGEVFTNSDGISELQFQVWKNNVKMDPEKWLANK